MKHRKRLFAVVLTIALGFGVWTAAVSFSPTLASFSDGDVLSASDLNSLLNDNLNAISDAVSDLDSEKLSTTGGTISGRTTIEGEAESTGDGDPETVFRVENTSATGAAAVFQSDNDDDIGAVNIKQSGTGPALSLKSLGGGPLISGAGESGAGAFVVEADGTIRVGDVQRDGDANLVLDAAEGTITNSVGSGLPLAYGRVASDGTKTSGTSNWTSSMNSSTYYIQLDDGANYDPDEHVLLVTVQGAVQAVTPVTSGYVSGGQHWAAVLLHDNNDQLVEENFHFVIYESP